MIQRTPWPPAQPRRSAAWMVTMTDLGFLVLAFFVVQFAMSTPRPSDWAELRAGLSQRLAPTFVAQRTAPSADLGVALYNNGHALDTAYLEALITQGALPALAPLGATLEATRDTVSLLLPPVPAGGESWSDPAGGQALGVAAEALRFIANRVTVRAFVAAGPADFGPGLARGLAAAEDVALLLAAGYEREIFVRASLGQGSAGVLGLAIEIDALTAVGAVP